MIPAVKNQWNGCNFRRFEKRMYNLIKKLFAKKKKPYEEQRDGLKPAKIKERLNLAKNAS